VTKHISANKHFRGWIIVARFVKQKPSTFSKNKSLVFSIIKNIAAKDFDKFSYVISVYKFEFSALFL
jgi:hypothetical protein